jgi:hypothetical protein
MSLIKGATTKKYISALYRSFLENFLPFSPPHGTHFGDNAINGDEKIIKNENENLKKLKMSSLMENFHL